MTHCLCFCRRGREGGPGAGPSRPRREGEDARDPGQDSEGAVVAPVERRCERGLGTTSPTSSLSFDNLLLSPSLIFFYNSRPLLLFYFPPHPHPLFPRTSYTLSI